MEVPVQGKGSRLGGVEQGGPQGGLRRRLGRLAGRRLAGRRVRGRRLTGRRLGGRRLGLAVGVPVVLLLGVSQALLPRLAVQRVRDRIKPYGELQHVSVSAFPAIELLWGKADAVSASSHMLTLSSQQLLKLTWEGRGVGEANLRVDTLKLRVPGVPEGVVLREVVSRKRGDRLFSEATLTRNDLAAGSPSGVRVQPLESEPGTVRVRASGSLFGVPASVEALVEAREGRVIAQPLNIPFGSFIELTLFSDPHVYVDSVSLSPVGGGGEEWRVAMRGTLR